MKRRYSIWGREYGADHDVELAQVDSNPKPVLDGFKAKTLTIKHSLFERGARQSKTKRYLDLRIVRNDGAKP